MYLKPKEFTERRSLCVIDTTRHAVHIPGAKSNIIVDTDFDSDLRTYINYVYK